MTLDGIDSPAGTAPLSLDEARATWNATDLVAIGMRADEARRRRHGDRVTYVRVAEVPLADAATWRPAPNAGEIRLAGKPPVLADAVALVRQVVGLAGATPVSAFELGELERLTGGGAALVEYLRALADAGLAGVGDARLDRLGDARRSIDALSIAGLGSLRFTIDRVPVDFPAFLHELRQLQRHTGALRSFAPLPREQDASAPTTGYHDAKAVALARLVLDNVTSIQVDWSLYGPKLAQVALTVGADDLDAVSALDDESEGRRRAPLEEVRRNIQAAALVPVERDGAYGRIG